VGGVRIALSFVVGEVVEDREGREMDDDVFVDLG
jgi:hypothetical protein